MLAATVLVGALAVTAVALGAVKSYEGTYDAPKCGEIGPPEPCRVAIESKIRHGRVTGIKNVTFNRLPTKCESGSETITKPPVIYPTKLKVKRNRRFHGSSVIFDGSGKVTIRGRYSQTFRRALGKLRVQSEGTGGRDFDCDTGTHSFRVHK